MHNMVRPRKRRMVDFKHDVRYFKPAGTRLKDLSEINITIDELESLRLSYLERIKQDDAARRMQVHQSTYQRTLQKTLQKIADALVNGKSIRVEGGDYTMPGKDGTGPRGPAGRQAQNRGPEGGRGGRRATTVPVGICRCPGCGHEQAHQQGIPCSRKKCPECGKSMIRKQEE